MLIVDLALTRFLDHLILLAGKQRPEHVRLRLLERRWAEGEVHIDVAEIGVTLLVGDPDLIEHGGVSELAEPTIDLIWREACLLRGVHEMRGDPRLRHHVCAEQRRTSLVRYRRFARPLSPEADIKSGDVPAPSTTAV